MILNKEIVAISGVIILGGIALFKGQAEIGAAAVGALAGYLAPKLISNNEANT